MGVRRGVEVSCPLSRCPRFLNTMIFKNLRNFHRRGRKNADILQFLLKMNEQIDEGLCLNPQTIIVLAILCAHTKQFSFSNFPSICCHWKYFTYLCLIEPHVWVNRFSFFFIIIPCYNAFWRYTQDLCECSWRTDLDFVGSFFIAAFSSTINPLSLRGTASIHHFCFRTDPEYAKKKCLFSNEYNAKLTQK